MMNCSNDEFLYILKRNRYLQWRLEEELYIEKKNT